MTKSNDKNQDVARFIESDLQSISLDLLLRVWISQLLDLALDGEPTNIELTFHQFGQYGFSVVDNGNGISQQDLQVICKCLP